LIHGDGMNTAFLSLGGNLGNRFLSLQTAMVEIGKHCGPVISSSRTYETEAWGRGSTGSYLNKVVVIRTDLDPLDLLGRLMKIESLMGRKRSGKRYADREIDLDILYYNSEKISLPRLKIPHPRLHLRNFVLVPLNEVAPSFIHPVLKRTTSSLLKKSPDVLKTTLFEPLRYICIEGNIGSGKSSLAAELAKHLNASILNEQFENNHLLPLFYSDRKAYAFPLEFSFALARFDQIVTHFKNHTGTIVSDYSFFKSLWFAQTNLKKEEFRFFKKQFYQLAANIPAPDLVIYLRTDIDNLAANIKKRNRPFEQNIDKEYLKRLDLRYEKEFAKTTFRNYTIDIKKYHPDLWKSSIKKIEKYIEENFGRNS
jgi:deoxyguanosine kinase